MESCAANLPSAVSAPATGAASLFMNSPLVMVAGSLIALAGIILLAAVARRHRTSLRILVAALLLGAALFGFGGVSVMAAPVLGGCPEDDNAQGSQSPAVLAANDIVLPNAPSNSIFSQGYLLGWVWDDGAEAYILGFWDGETSHPYLAIPLLANDAAPDSALDPNSVDLNPALAGIQHEVVVYAWGMLPIDNYESVKVIYHVSYNQATGNVIIKSGYDWAAEHHIWDLDGSEQQTALTAIGAVELAYEQQELSLSDYIDCHLCTAVGTITINIPYTVSNTAAEIASAAIVLPSIYSAISPL